MPIGERLASTPQASGPAFAPLPFPLSLLGPAEGGTFIRAAIPPRRDHSCDLGIEFGPERNVADLADDHEAQKYGEPRPCQGMSEQAASMHGRAKDRGGMQSVTVHACWEGIILAGFL